MRPLLQRVVELQRGATSPPQPIELLLPDASPIVLGDADRLELVLVNLLENARKYSPEDTPVRVQLRATEDVVTVAVQDEGVGIPAEEQAGIFDRFRRGSNVDQGIAGLGLGLYITHEIVQAHGGQLRVESMPGRGSTFIATLPRMRDHADADDHAAGHAAGAQGEPDRRR